MTTLKKTLCGAAVASLVAGTGAAVGTPLTQMGSSALDWMLAAEHVLLIGTDEATCHVARNASIPCFVDAMGHARKGEEQVAPLAAVDVEASAAGRGEVNMFGGQVRLKWFYVRALLRLGFHVVFSDADVAWLQDPFRNWDRSFDLQGLSDIVSTNLTVGSHHKVACLDKARDRI